MSQVNVGDTVLIQGLVDSNGTDTHPGIVNRCWSSTLPVRVNAAVFPDHGSPTQASSVMIYATEDEAKLSSESPRGWLKPQSA